MEIVCNEGKKVEQKYSRQIEIVIPFVILVFRCGGFRTVYH